jgi:hypothetical protein
MQWMMLQQDQPEDFVIATGVQYSVRQFIEWTAEALGLQIRWQGEGVDEVGYANGQAIIRIDPRYFRPTEVETLLGDPSKAKKNSVGCQRSPHNKCAKKWSTTTFSRPNNTHCSKPTATPSTSASNKPASPRIGRTQAAITKYPV